MAAYCCINGCKNNVNNYKEYPNTKILFHVFPSNPELKARWLKAIGRPDWDPPDHASICSDHFSSYQINSNFESSLVEVCRICLATDDDVTLYSLQHGQLKQCMDTILAMNNDSHIEGLPQFVCYECGIHLRKCYKLIKKVKISQAILRRIFAENGEITESLVKNLNRDNFELKSTLESHNITPTYLFNYEFNYQQSNSCLTSIEYLYDVNEMKTEIDTNSDTISVCTDHSDDVIELEQEVDCIQSDGDNVLYLEDEINVGEEHSILQNNDDLNGDTNNSALSETSTDENSENFVLSTEKDVQTSNIQSDAKPTRPRKKSTKTQIKEAPFEKYFDVVTFKTLQEKIDDWHKTTESPSWIRRKNRKYEVHKCEICSKIFATSQAHKQHLMLHDPIAGSAECTICKIRQRNKKAVRCHMRSVHNSKYYCKLCPKNFSNRTSAEKHHALHMGRMYKCERCSFTSRHMSALSKHKQDDHPHAFACELCGRACVNLKGLQQHRHKLHPGQTVPASGLKHHCEECNFSFMTEEALRVHLLTSVQHKNSKRDSSMENTCRYCGQNFSSLIHLRRHVHFDHVYEKRRKQREAFNSTEYPITCDHCDVVVQSRHEHYWHMRREHPLKRYQRIVNAVCEVCGRGFQNEAQLNYHKLRHSSRNAPCPICQKLFYDNTQVKKHVANVHRPERPFACVTCGMTFKNQSNYLRHNKIHTDVTPYECSLCGKKVKHKVNLHVHVRTVHQKMFYPSQINRKKRTRKRAKSDNHAE